MVIVRAHTLIKEYRWTCRELYRPLRYRAESHKIKYFITALKRIAGNYNDGHRQSDSNLKYSLKIKVKHLSVNRLYNTDIIDRCCFYLYYPLPSFKILHNIYSNNTSTIFSS